MRYIALEKVREVDRQYRAKVQPLKAFVSTELTTTNEPHREEIITSMLSIGVQIESQGHESREYVARESIKRLYFHLYSDLYGDLHKLKCLLHYKDIDAARALLKEVMDEFDI